MSDPKPVKLTKPQLELLRKLANGEQSINHNNLPSLTLRQLGFATARSGTFAGRSIFTITEAGRARLVATPSPQTSGAAHE